MKLRRLVAGAILVAWSSFAAAAWHEAKSPHFIIYSEGSAEQLRQFATRLEKFDRAVRVVRNMEDPPLGDHGRLTVYVLKDAAAVARMYGDARSDVAGFYSPRASGSIAFVHREKTTGVPSAYREFLLTADMVFFHEYFHHMMLSNGHAALPRWVVEGFAEFFSTASIENDGSVLLGRAANHRARGLRTIADVTLDEMLGDSFGKLKPDEIDELYGRSWLLTHYLFSSTARRGQLERYLHGIQQGQPALASAQAAFGDLKQLNRELDKYLSSQSLTGVRVAAERLPIGAITVRTMSEAESEIMPIRMRSDRGVNEKTAPEVAAKARAVAAKYPNDPFVQGTLAEAEFDVGNFAAAIAAADRALAARPDDLQALIYKGQALMEQAKADPKAADWNKIRSWFIRANRRDTEAAEPLLLYYQSFAAAGARPTDAAVEGLIYAQALAPQDTKLRIDTVIELLERNRIAEARLAFTAIAYNPHAEATWRERSLKIMDAIVAGKPKDALALMRAPMPDPKTAKSGS